MLLPQAIDQIEMMSRDDRLRGMLLSSRLILGKNGVAPFHMEKNRRQKKGHNQNKGKIATEK